MSLWNGFSIIVQGLKSADVKSNSTSGLKLLQLDINDFVKDPDPDTYDKDGDAIDVHKMRYEFEQIYNDYQRDTSYGISLLASTCKKEKAKFVEKWYKLFKEFRTKFQYKQQRYAINIGEQSGGDRKVFFDSQVDERMRQIRAEKIADIDEKILKKFNQSLKSHKQKSKRNCIITHINLTGKLQCCINVYFDCDHHLGSNKLIELSFYCFVLIDFSLRYEIETIEPAGTVLQYAQTSSFTDTIFFKKENYKLYSKTAILDHFYNDNSIVLIQLSTSKTNKSGYQTDIMVNGKNRKSFSEKFDLACHSELNNYIALYCENTNEIKFYACQNSYTSILFDNGKQPNLNECIWSNKDSNKWKLEFMVFNDYNQDLIVVDNFQVVRIFDTKSNGWSSRHLNLLTNDSGIKENTNISGDDLKLIDNDSAKRESNASKFIKFLVTQEGAYLLCFRESQTVKNSIEMETVLLEKLTTIDIKTLPPFFRIDAIESLCIKSVGTGIDHKSVLVQLGKGKYDDYILAGGDLCINMEKQRPQAKIHLQNVDKQKEETRKYSTSVESDCFLFLPFCLLFLN